MSYEIDSIRATAKHLKESGYNISESALRSWVKRGYIPAVYSGRRAYISYSKVLKFLETGMPTPTHTDSVEDRGIIDISPAPGIKRIG